MGKVDIFESGAPGKKVFKDLVPRSEWEGQFVLPSEEAVFQRGFFSPSLALAALDTDLGPGARNRRIRATLITGDWRPSKEL